MSLRCAIFDLENGYQGYDKKMRKLLKYKKKYKDIKKETIRKIKMKVYAQKRLPEVKSVEASV